MPFDNHYHSARSYTSTRRCPCSGISGFSHADDAFTTRRRCTGSGYSNPGSGPRIPADATPICRS